MCGRRVPRVQFFVDQVCSFYGKIFAEKTLPKIISNGLLRVFRNAYILSVFSESTFRRIIYQMFLHKT